MTARGAVHAILATDAASDDPGTLGALGVETVYASPVPDTPTEQCFIVIRWDPTAAVFGHTGASRVLTWAHDKNLDYGRITDVLARCRALLTTVVHIAGADGWTLTQADWRGTSGDLQDPAFHTVTRWAAFDVAARQTT